MKNKEINAIRKERNSVKVVSMKGKYNRKAFKVSSKAIDETADIIMALSGII